MPGINVPLDVMVGAKEVVISTSEKILRLRSARCQVCSVNHSLTPINSQDRLGDLGAVSLCLSFCYVYPLTLPPQVREFYEVLRVATGRVANLLNEGAPAHQLPQEILTSILYLAVDHGSEEHTKQVITLTHVCQYWRTLLLSYPRMWSTIRVKPGNPSLISEWLERSQKVPVTVIAEFSDAYEHPPCRYQDSATAELANTSNREVCSRHEAILSLDQLLPHRSRIHDLDILVHSSDPDWETGDHEDEPMLFHHLFFRETLPNLQRLDFRATHVEQDRYMIPVPGSLFAGELPRLKDLKYLGVTGGLTERVKNLVSCEIGYWSKSAGPNLISHEELETLFHNNKNVRSLALNDCELLVPDQRFTTTTPMMDLEFLKISCSISDDLEAIFKSIHVPQFKSLDTVQLFLPSGLLAVATDGFGHTFEFPQFIGGDPNFYPLRHLGAEVTTLRLDRGMTRRVFGNWSGWGELFRSLDAVRVLEFDGSITSVKAVLRNVLSRTGVFPELKIIRVGIGWDSDCEEVLELLAAVLRLRMEEGTPLAAVEPLPAEGDDGDGLGQELRAKWEEHYIAEGIQSFLSEWCSFLG